ncbi:MAG: hypothetical protein IPK71_27920 [Myxococcales bacterium]|nr:hypothetical protein [Myxococcales bacterium]
MNDLEPLDDELSRLFADERVAHTPEPVARGEVLARVEKSVLLATLAQGAAQGGGAKVGAAVGSGATALARLKAAMVVGALGAFAAGVAVGRASAPRSAPPPAPSAIALSSAPTATESAAPVVTSAPSAVVSAVPTAQVPPSATPSATMIPTAVGDLSKEQILLDTARAALARGRAEDALAAVASHAAQFPHGRLVEDREAVAVQALAAAGRTDEARARAQRFRARYPRSIYLPAIDRSLSHP